MEYRISTDFWHETRNELRKRFGPSLCVLPQAAPAGDQSPHHLMRKAAEEGMLRLAGRTQREEIACRIADAVERVLPLAKQDILLEPAFAHIAETLPLARRRVTKEDVANALAPAEIHRKRLEEERAAIEADLSLKEQPRWYRKLTGARRGCHWNQSVEERFSLQETAPTIPMELHVIRLGDVAFATSRFKLSEFDALLRL